MRLLLDVFIRENAEMDDMDLYWDSWDKHQLRTGASPRPVRSRATPSSVMSPSPPRTPPLLKQRCGKCTGSKFFLSLSLSFCLSFSL